MTLEDQEYFDKKFKELKDELTGKITASEAEIKELSKTVQQNEKDILILQGDIRTMKAVKATEDVTKDKTKLSWQKVLFFVITSIIAISALGVSMFAIFR